MRGLTDLERKFIRERTSNACAYASGWGDGADIQINFHEFGIYYEALLYEAVLNETLIPYISYAFREWRQKCKLMDI